VIVNVSGMTMRVTSTTGIAAGFIAYVFLKTIRGQGRQVHPLMWLVSIGFLIYFAGPWVQQVLTGPPPAA